MINLVYLKKKDFKCDFIKDNIGASYNIFIILAKVNDFLGT